MQRRGRQGGRHAADAARATLQQGLRARRSHAARTPPNSHRAPSRPCSLLPPYRTAPCPRALSLDSVPTPPALHRPHPQSRSAPSSTATSSTRRGRRRRSTQRRCCSRLATPKPKPKPKPKPMPKPKPKPNQRSTSARRDSWCVWAAATVISSSTSRRRPSDVTYLSPLLTPLRGGDRLMY